MHPGKIGPLVESLQLERVCELMPKVEIHAHLNGSVSAAILEKVAKARKTTTPEVNSLDDHCMKTFNRSCFHDLTSAGTNSISFHEKTPLLKCWDDFARIHQVIRTPEILFQVTCLIIEEFHLDNVIHLELRTSPKKVLEIPSKKIYIETIIKAIEYCKIIKKLPISVKLLISMDRDGSARSYLESVCLAQWYRIMKPGVVVGLDLSGNPTKGDIKQIMFALNFARKLGLSISLHLPEIVNHEESKSMLEHGPARVAHGQFLHKTTGGSEELWTLLKTSGACMETCITSNLITRVCPTLEQHYTDDSGVFKTNLSEEYKKLLQILPLSKSELREVCLRSASFIFGTEAAKIQLTQRIIEWWSQ